MPADPASQFHRLQHATVNDNSGRNDDFDTDPITYGPNGYQIPVTDMGQTRKDFLHPAFAQGGITHLNWMMRGRRLGSPGFWGTNPISRMKALPSSDAGALAYRGGTLLNPHAMNPADPANPDQSLWTGSSLIEQLLPQALYYGVDNHPKASANLNPAYRYYVGRKSSYPIEQPDGWLELFIRNYDYLQRFAPPNPVENPTQYDTYLNRRALMTTWNPVSSAAPAKITPRDPASGDATSTVPVWNPNLAYDLGDVVSYHGINYVCMGPVQSGSPVNGGQGGMPPGVAPGGGVAIDHPNRVMPWEPRAYQDFPTRASVNAGTFGQLYLAFWQVMAQNASLKRPRMGTEYAAPQYQAPNKDA
ncbi:MAG: hypothetical protein M3325_12780, partial [Actinomycetota bacterium]|nr:hypothetical protein [Actinomycetota bacterium]